MRIGERTGERMAKIPCFLEVAHSASSTILSSVCVLCAACIYRKSGTDIRSLNFLGQVCVARYLFNAQDQFNFSTTEYEHNRI